MIRNTIVVPAILILLACTAREEPAASPPEETPAPTDRIGIAMSAGPSAITSAATIMDWDSAGNLVELRPGTNGWLCVPDDLPQAPGNAAICLDGPWQAWFGALTARTTPAISQLGVSYMLQGGAAPSNTDPFATAPAPGETWIMDEPHLMIVVPDPALLDGFPVDPNSGGPYVMWKGTPYAHLMVPVRSPGSTP